MMVTFVSQCEKKALNKTRRVLDSFANRIGDNTWQTVITDEGLSAVKKLLRKTASKNTAVSCYWLRSRSRSELVWIIGNRSKFNSQGFVPVNVTQRDIVNTQGENNWYYQPLITSLTALAALFHDFGKASECFQKKLKLTKHKNFGDPLRHEWVSTLLLNAFVNSESDELWLERLANGELNEATLKKVAAENKEKPLKDLPNAAGLVAWLVVSHHRLPLCKDHNKWKGDSIPAENLATLLKRISKDWGYENNNDNEFSNRLSQCLTFPNGLPSKSELLLKDMMKWARRLKDSLPLLKQAMDDGSWRIVLYHARLALMLGDHNYSSKDADKNWKSDLDLIANTYHANSEGHTKGQAKQKLDEHLVHVARAAIKIVNLLPLFEHELPRAFDVKLLKKKSPPAFNWQDQAVDAIKSWQNKLPINEKEYGFFAINMASTGCGKTFANAKVMRALSIDGDSLRFTLALGLRTLTLQTGDEYRNRIGLGNDELAVLIGSRAVMDLHYQQREKQLESEQKSNEEAGSESLESLLDDGYIEYECAIPVDKLSTILANKEDQKFLFSPVLACTIDHIIAATECKRGGRYILPSLRLMSSDLVIDEIDDFDGGDLIAIGRLIHLAGMLGCKVMISSATIPPDLAQGYLNVYRDGWLLFSKTRNISRTIGCAWIDEFNTQVEKISETSTALETYKKYHETFIEMRVNLLKKALIKRKPEIILCENVMALEDNESIEQAYFEIIQQAIIQKHNQHGYQDKKTGKTVSFGVVRVANIKPCVALTKYLAGIIWPNQIEIRVMAYHSQQVLLLRSVQENHLDQVLKRNEKKGEQPAALSNLIIRQHLDGCKSKHMIFILVATPVEEVGRDHDFDWAVIEPSSMRSIIQLAGRVLRHRNFEPKIPNISLLQYNLKGVQNKKPAFSKPGYERQHPIDINYSLETHDLSKLINQEILVTGINAFPRIQRSMQLHPRTNLGDLEHYSISKLLTSYENTAPATMQGWLSPQCWWLTALPQKFNRFRDSTLQERIFLMPGDNGPIFAQKDERGSCCIVTERFRIKKQELSELALSRLWLYRNYEEIVREYAMNKGETVEQIALKYGELAISVYGDEMPAFYYSSQLGLSSREEE